MKMNTIEIILFLSAISLDTFLTMIGYSLEKIQLKYFISIFISIVNSMILFGSYYFGKIITQYIPIPTIKLISFILLVILGILKIANPIIKKYIKKIKTKNLPTLMIKIYASPNQADLDDSKTISLKEALFLSLALSLDNIGVVIGISLFSLPIIHITILSCLLNLCTIYMGYYMGTIIQKKVPLNITWISGACLLLLAFIKYYL